MKQKIFQNFPPANKQAWVNQAKKDLKGGDFEKQLVSVTSEGFPLSPYYAAEDTADTQWVKAFDNQINPPQETEGLPARYWVNAVEITGTNEAAVNSEIKYVLDNGADGLILPLSQDLDWDRILAEVALPSVAIWIKPLGNDPLPSLEAFSSWLEQRSLEPSALRGGILWDGLSLGFGQPIQIEKQTAQVASIHRLFQSYPHFKSICLDTSVYANTGSTAVQELGYGLSALVELWDGLTEIGIEAEALFSDLFVLTAVGSDYFMEIAKLKTFRIALHHLAKQYQVVLAAADIQLFGMTSRWSKSSKDPYNNLLRNTTEAMSAVIGGCNTVFVIPHDHSSSFTKRMARNISTILREEGYFDKTLDPAAGSYYIENLTRTLFEESWGLLTKTESQGGWWKLYLTHHIQQEIKATRTLKFQQLIQGNTEKVGIAESIAPISLAEEFPEEDYQLKPCSHFFPFEHLT